MKIRNKYGPSCVYEASTKDLIETAGSALADGGQIESLNARVTHLTAVLANLIDRCKFTDSDILAFSACYWYETLEDTE